MTPLSRVVEAAKALVAHSYGRLTIQASGGNAVEIAPEMALVAVAYIDALAAALSSLPASPPPAASPAAPACDKCGSTDPKVRWCKVSRLRQSGATDPHPCESDPKYGCTPCDNDSYHGHGAKEARDA